MNSQPVDVIPIFAPDDALVDGIAAIKYSLFPDIYKSLTVMRAAVAAYFENAVFKKNCIYHAAYFHDEIVGYSAADVMSGWVYDLYVHRDYKRSSGKKLYVGSKLLKANERVLSLNSDTVCLSPSEEGQSFYTSPRHGYVWYDCSHSCSKRLRRYGAGFSGTGIYPVKKLNDGMRQDVRDIVTGCFPNYSDAGIGDVCKSIDSAVTDCFAPTFSCFMSGKMIGFLQAYRKLGLSETISKLYVLPQYQQKYGIDRALMTAYLDYLKIRGVQSVDLQVMTDPNDKEYHKNLIEFYKRFGFSLRQYSDTCMERFFQK